MPYHSHYEAKPTKEEQLIDAAEFVKEDLRKYYEQWGFPMAGNRAYAFVRNVRCPLATYAEFREFMSSNGYVKFMKSFNNKIYMLPGDVELSADQLVESIMKRQEIEERMRDAKHTRKVAVG